MPTNSYGSVATPRIYVDYIQYAKAIGMIDSFNYDETRVSSNNPEALWDMNPSNVAEFTIIDAGDGAIYAGKYQANFKYVGNDTAGLQFRNLISTTNYGALLGHNVGLFDPERYVESRVREGYASHTSILGNSKCRNNIGTNIWKINHFVSGGNPIEDLTFFDRLGFKINKGTGGLDWNVGDVIRMGAFSTGKYFDFPYSPELDLSISYVHDGVKTIRTAGGSDLRDFNYPKPKKWGDLAPWTHIDLSEYAVQYDAINNEDYSSAGRTGKRVFKIKYSYLDKTDMFPMNFENNMAGHYSAYDEELSENGIELNNSELGINIPGSDDLIHDWEAYNLSEDNITALESNGEFLDIETTTESVDQGVKLPANKINWIGLDDITNYRLNVNLKQIGGAANPTMQIRFGDVMTAEFTIDSTSTKYTFYLSGATENDDLLIYNRASGSSTTFRLDSVVLTKVLSPPGEFFESNSGVHKDNIIGNFLTFTMGGQIPFIFQPDNEVNEFAICKLDKPSFNITQEANGVYSTSMTFREL